MTKERLVAFTDAVLAIIMTILVLELDKPAEPTIAAFWDLRESFFAYTLSFFWLGSLWMGLNTTWEKAVKIDNKVIWLNLIMLFFSSFIPYATSLISEYFRSHLIQAFYGIIVVLMTICNYAMHKALEDCNDDLPEFLEISRGYRKVLLPDIAIKIVALVISLLFWAPAMIFGVLAAAVYIIGTRFLKF